MKNMIYYLYYIYYYFQYPEFRFALNMHHSVRQCYDDKYPYFKHLLMVVESVRKFNYLLDEKDRLNAIMIALLHDSIEDCRLTYNDIKKLYGSVVANGVFACTESTGRNRKERHDEAYFNRINNDFLGKFVKLCDIYANTKYGYSTGSRMSKLYKGEFPSIKEKISEDRFSDIFASIEELHNNG